MNDSFSFDENANIVSSTPSKKARTEYVCQHCSKVYVVKHYFNLHVDKCAPTANTSAATVNSEISSILDLSKASGNLQFKVPFAPNKKQTVRKPTVKPKFTCTYCLRPYICEKSFKTHVMVHRIEDASSRYPNRDKVLENVEEMSSSALAKVSDVPCYGETGALFKKLTKQLTDSLPNPEWTSFARNVISKLLSCVIGEKFLLPSILLSKLLEQVEVLLNDDEFCMASLKILKIPQFESVPCDLVDGNIGRQFLLEFVLNSAHEILCCISRIIREDNPAPPKIIDTNLDEEDRNVIYYIGGSIIRGYFRMAHRYKSSTMWNQIAQTLRQKLLSDDPDVIPDATWTRAVSRGGLLFISPSCQEFLLSLTKIVMTLVQSDGSIDYPEVIQHVTSTSLVLIWDSMIGDSLSGSVSLNLMNDVIKFFCRSCGRAFAKKKLNLLRDRPVISLTTRHLAATRKGRK